MSLIVPGAVQKPLGKETQPAMSAHNLIVVHTMVGYLTSTYTLFKKDGYTGNESHFGMGGIWGPDADAQLDGAVWQFQDLMFTADAQFEANPVAWSIETADNAPKFASQIMRWTVTQAESLAQLIAVLCHKDFHANCPPRWACHENGIPAVLIPDTKPGRRGLAYHAQGSGSNIVPGGQNWSPGSHECPGAARIDQFVHEVIPRVQDIMNPKPEVEMNLSDVITLNTQSEVDNLNAGNPSRVPQFKLGGTVTVEYLLEWGSLSSQKASVRVNGLQNQVTALSGQVNTLSDQIDALIALIKAPKAGV